MKNPKILLFDEATSALDQKSEKDIQKMLDELSEGKTTIVIAHRLSTIRFCDRIYEFNQGTIVASGTYEQLQQRSASFRELVDLQRR